MHSIEVFYPQFSKRFIIEVKEDDSDEHVRRLIDKGYFRLHEALMITDNGIILNAKNLSRSILTLLFTKPALSEQEHPF